MASVFIILKNSDFTEGRGPMMLHRVCDSYDSAYSYIQDQKGIYGTTQDKVPKSYTSTPGKFHFNGYDIIEMEIENYETLRLQQQEELKSAAIKKLTVEEQKALGLWKERSV